MTFACCVAQDDKLIIISVRDRIRNRRAGTIVGLLRASHPGPVVAVTFVAYGYARACGLARSDARSAATAVLTGQLAIGWQNDWCDAERDRRAGRREKPIVAGQVSAQLVELFSLLSALGCVITSHRNGRRSAIAHLLAVASAGLYNAGLKATVWSWLPYGISFFLLPVSIDYSTSGTRRMSYWAAGACASLGIAAHFLNAVPDREMDRSQGVLGLPQRLDERENAVISLCLVAVSSAFVSFGPVGRRRDALGFFALTCALGIAATRLKGRSGFRLVLVLAALDVCRLLIMTRADR
jgi:4-hydroxybenzoate polyprenyltransferase